MVMSKAAFPGLLAIGILLAANQSRADVPANTPYAESATHPIRVYYDGKATQTQAETVLGYLDAAWVGTIDQTGFAIPLREVDGVIVPGFNMYITKVSDPNTACTFEVLGDNPDTPQLDCPVLGILPTDVVAQDPDWIEGFSWHLLNHASLHAIDCLEMSVPTNDIFSEGIQRIFGKEAPEYLTLENTAFPDEPEWSLDAWYGWTTDVAAQTVNTQIDPFYSFGTSIYAVFLEERYGARDGKLLAEIWLHTPENGHVTHVYKQNTEVIEADVPNVPNWFDAISAVLTAKGSSFDQAYEELAVWRLLTGSYSDGEHFKDASKYPAPVMSQKHDPSTLPITNATPTKLVARYGTSYVFVDSSKLPANQALLLNFAGAQPFHWASQAICTLGSSTPAEVTSLTLDASYAGSVYIPNASRCTAVVLAAENLSEGSYTPDDYTKWNLEGSYQYSISAVAMPTVASVTPAVLHPGQGTVTLAVKGTQLVDGSKLAATFSATGVVVNTVSHTDDQSLSLTVDVAADAQLGTRDLSVNNGVGLAASLPSAITIATAGSDDAGADGADVHTNPFDASGDEVDTNAGSPAEKDSSGCSCASVPPPTNPVPGLLGLLVLAGAVGRRTRTRRTAA